MPTVDIPGSGYKELSSLSPTGVPIGTIVRTTAGDYYRLAVSALDLSTVPVSPSLPQARALAAPKLASATAVFDMIGTLDVARNVSVTTSLAGYDGGRITFNGRVSGLPTSEIVTPDQLNAATVEGKTIFDAGQVTASKETVGTSLSTVSLGTGSLLGTGSAPAVVAVAGAPSLRWLYANAEIITTALPLLKTWNPSSGVMELGLVTTMQGLIDTRNAIFRLLIDDIQKAGISISDDTQAFYTATNN